KRHESPVVSSGRSRDDVRVISALCKTDGSSCHPGAFPCYMRFRVTPLRDVNQLREVVSLARIDRRQIAPFSFSRLVLAKFSFISWKRRRGPRSHRRGGRLIARKGDADNHQWFCDYNERGLHHSLWKSPPRFHRRSFCLIVT